MPAFRLCWCGWFLGGVASFACHHTFFMWMFQTSSKDSFLFLAHACQPIIGVTQWAIVHKGYVINWPHGFSKKKTPLFLFLLILNQKFMNLCCAWMS